MKEVSRSSIDVYLDGVSLHEMEKYGREDLVKGFTTNPSLMRALNVSNYKSFASEALSLSGDKPVSFEVISDSPDNILREGLTIHSWAANAYVKVPIVSSSGTSNADSIKQLSSQGVKVNVTAVFTASQVDEAFEALDINVDSVISIFSGRLADTGIDPSDLIKFAVQSRNRVSKTKILWASTREPFNIYQAELAGSDIITVSMSIFEKYTQLAGKDPTAFSIETSKMFLDDAIAAGYSI